MPRRKVASPRLREALLDRARRWVPVCELVESAIAGEAGPRTAEAAAAVEALEAGEPIEVPGWRLASALGDMGRRDPRIDHGARYTVEGDGSYREASAVE